MSSIFDSYDRTLGSALEVKVNSASGICFPNRIWNEQIINQVNALHVAYPIMGLNIDDVIDDSHRVYQFTRGLDRCAFKNIMLALDSTPNIRFLACTILKTLDIEIDLDNAITVCYDNYVSNLSEYNKQIIKLSVLSDPNSRSKYMATICAKFNLGIPLIGSRSEIGKSILHYWDNEEVETCY